ncbi:MAG: hypothetical protein WBQ60_05120 [Asticcacaulis sp.]
MPHAHDSQFLNACKRDAAKLLKALRSDEEWAHATALERFSRLITQAQPAQVQLKHALAVVALESGYPSWVALKQAVDDTMRGALDFSEFFASPCLKDSINHWFATYDEAKAHQLAHGGILLPYRHQFFVTSEAILPRLGYEADDPDWHDIGHDFARPASLDAQTRIKSRLTRRFASAA